MINAGNEYSGILQLKKPTIAHHFLLASVNILNDLEINATPVLISFAYTDYRQCSGFHPGHVDASGMQCATGFRSIPGGKSK